MIDHFWAAIYGFIQGISEFLPVSSSGHLALLPFFFKLEDPGVVFDLMMHFGTALAVCVYFHKELKQLIKTGLKCITFEGRNRSETYFAQNFIIATITSVVAILILKNLAENYGRNSLLIGFNLIFFGLIMAIADRTKVLDYDLTHRVDLKRSMIIGLSQALAIFPGVSRSGITMTAARFMGLSRQKAGEFSFLLSLPIIFASVLVKIPEVLKQENNMVSTDILLMGIIVSFFIGILSIHFFLRLLNRFGLIYYAYYRFFIGGLVIYLWWR